MPRVTMAGWLIISVIAGGCSRAVERDRPPALRYGEEPCAQCRMLISEARFAASGIDARGMVQHFDSVACVVQYQRRHPEGWRRVWVHDYETEQWLQAQAAWFVRCPTCVSPMGDQVIAVSTPEQAARLSGIAGASGVRLAELSSLVEIESPQ